MRCSLSVCLEGNKGALMSQHIALIVFSLVYRKFTHDGGGGVQQRFTRRVKRTTRYDLISASHLPTTSTCIRTNPTKQHNNHLLTFAAQNMAPGGSDRHSPAPGLLICGPPVLPALPVRLGRLPFQSGQTLTGVSPDLSRPYGPTVCPSMLSCAVMTRCALTRLVMESHGLARR